MYKIVSYDPIKGKGVYINLKGRKIGFMYRQFGGEKMYPIGTIVELDNEFLLRPKKPVYKLLWILRRSISWLSSQET